MSSSNNFTPKQQKRLWCICHIFSVPLIAYMGSRLALAVSESWAWLIGLLAVIAMIGILNIIVRKVVRSVSDKPEWRNNVLLLFVGVFTLGLILVVPEIINF